MQDRVKVRTYTVTVLKYFLRNALEYSNIQIVSYPSVYICCNF